MGQPPPVDVDQRIVALIAERLAGTGSAPSMHEIATALGISTSSVYQRLDRLVDAGSLRKLGKGRARGYLPLVEPHHCPACGQTLPLAAAS